MELRGDWVRFALLLASLELGKLLRSGCDVELWQALTHKRWLFHQPIDESGVAYGPQAGPYTDTWRCLQSSSRDVSWAKLALAWKLHSDLLSYVLKFAHFHSAIRKPTLTELSTVPVIIEQAEKCVDEKGEALVIRLLEHLGVDRDSCAFLKMLYIDLEQLQIVE